MDRLEGPPQTQRPRRKTGPDLQLPGLAEERHPRPDRQRRPLEGGLFGKGTWSLSTDHTTLTLTFDRLDADLERSTLHTLRIGEEKNHPVLYTRVGDPKECHVFTLTRQGD
ncbi:hypothetical protein [Streptomyces sp. Ac-502]|uniref:hypothetical protein n=1 Tax=Streptomyces sp. Ac-502 TaxID=3342801 RepID=UPI003862C9F1